VKYFSMFSGIGGFELGINKAIKNVNAENKLCNRQQLLEGNNNTTILQKEKEATCVGYSEVDKYAIQIYQRHYKEHKAYGDATRIDTKDLPDLDLLVGGFPCQAFSIAGKRGGFQDTRGTLFFEIARILADKRPGYLLLENVKGLLSHDSGKTFETILKVLTDIGYVLQWEVLNSKNFGVPQNRERVFIVGHLRGERRPEVFPISKATQGDIRADTTGTQTRGDKSDGINTIRRTPLTDDMRIRRLTPTECERLQGFPDGWTEGVSDTQRYKCLGNAVTVNVIEAIASKLLKEEL